MGAIIKNSMKKCLLKCHGNSQTVHHLFQRTNLGRQKWASASTVRVGSSLVTGMRIVKFYTFSALIHAEVVPKMYPSAY